MKNKFVALFSIVLLSVFSTGFLFAVGKGYNIKFRVKGISDTIIYIGNHYADKTYITDTVNIDSTGSFVFEGEEDLPGGIYFAYLPNKVYFEFLIGEQKFSIETDTVDLVANMKITGSRENMLYKEFQLYNKSQRKLMDSLRKRLDVNKDIEDSAKAIRKEIDAVNDGMNKYMSDIIEKNPDALLSAMIKSNKPIEIPESLKDDKGNEIDSLFGLKYHQKHFFDNLNFADERLLRTPIIHQKMMEYLEKLTYPQVDSISKSVDFIVEKARANDEVFHYVVSTLTSHYERSNIMGMDAVFVHMAESYYMSGQAKWADSTVVSKMTERVYSLKPALIGKVAHEMVLPDTSFYTKYSMHAIDSKYTLVFFFEPDCGHCKKMADKLKENYEALLDYGVEIYAVSTMTDMDKLKTFIEEKEIDWISVSDPYRESNFRAYYDIYSTPILYLLNDKKEIIAKRMGVEQLLDLLENEKKKEESKRKS